MHTADFLRYIKTKLRFGKENLEWTSGKLLKGAGAGTDPVEIDVPGVPSGLIAMWHGLIANIPSGWVICDGNSGTPNLLAKFVEGVATAATNPGTTGGAKSKTTSGHVHQMSDAGGESYRVLTDTDNEQLRIDRGNTSSSGRVSSQIASSTASISDIRPPYYDIAFIMKT